MYSDQQWNNRLWISQAMIYNTKSFSQAEEARISVQHNSYYMPNTANNIRQGRVEDMEQRKKFMSSTKT